MFIYTYIIYRIIYPKKNRRLFFSYSYKTKLLEREKHSRKQVAFLKNYELNEKMSKNQNAFALQ